MADLRAGKWNKAEYSKGRGLHGRTLGIVGLGQIGREIAIRAKAFGMHVAAWSRNLTHEEADRLGLRYCQTPIEVARISDAVSINVAANAETKNLVNAEFLAAMKPGAYLINTARGSVVDEAALAAAIKEKGIRAGLDVFQNEPAGGTGAWDSALARQPGVYGTHHVGASTDQAQVAIAHETIRIVQEFIQAGDRAQLREPPGQERRHATSSRCGTRTGPGVLADVFRILADAHDQRRGSGEHHLSRRARDAGAHPSRRGSRRRRAGGGAPGQRRTSSASS